MSLNYKSICLLACSIGSQAAIANTPESMAGYWKLDEPISSPTSTVDQTGLNNGIVQGSTTFNVSGVNIQSKSAEFTGSGQYIEIPHNDQYLLDSGMVVFWFWPENTNSRYGLFSKEATSFDTGGHLSIFQESDDRISVRLQSNTTSYTIYSTALVNEDAWNHVSFVFGTGGMELYLNGTLQGTNPYEGGLGPTSGGTGNFEPIVLGGNSWQSDNLLATPVKNFFPGKIDEVGLLSERWDSSVIADLFTDTGPGTNMNLSDFAGPFVFYVRTRGSDTNDGLSPQTAFRSIQKAVDNCKRPGSTVYVGAGTYQESIEIGTGAGVNAVSGTDELPITLVADVSGSNTFDDPGPVMLSGAQAYSNGITMNSVEYWKIQGFSFQDQQNYGIYATNTAVDIIDCTFDVPSSFAIFALINNNTSITGCTFNRTASSGSSIWVQTASLSTPESIVINGNDLTMKGDLYKSTGYNNGFNFTNSGSSQTRYVYGIIVLAWNTSIGDVVISNNKVSDYYLPILSLVSNTDDVSTIANNTITGSLYSIYNYTYQSGSSITINNIIESCYYGLLGPNYQSGTSTVSGLLEHNITISMAQFQRSFEFDVITNNPLFTDPINADFSLQRGSRAIDAGTNTNAPGTDIAGNSRPSDGDDDGIPKNDLGAYELVTERQKLKIVQWREISGHRDMSNE